ncbi:universal stress protein [Halomicroarcula sp. GCM10025817]|uniref:universal stress protein n=1 Tax=Haloarcula TaxID=2237 RepID=UPI0023E81D68|nr:universal stress protein [Halomicroarcula sp. SYNS111]
MTFVVPFDGTAESEAALERASEIGGAMGEPVVAVTVVPTSDAAYARGKGWLEATEAFGLDTIVERVSAQVRDIAPDARFECLESSREATSNSIAKPIRRFAKTSDASMVFIGSDNTGRLTTTLGSVGNRISTDRAYDVVIVRTHPPGR